MFIIEKAKVFFNQEIEKSWLSDYFKKHLAEFERWADKMLQKYPEADRDVVLLSMWLHDIGFSIGEEVDHAISGEIIAREWLTSEGCDPDMIEKIAHCVRAHRCSDVIPETLEAKIIAFSDSASHITQGIYFDIVKCEKERSKYDALKKIERDWRDLSLFPEIKDELADLYEAWKHLIEVYRRTNI